MTDKLTTRRKLLVGIGASSTIALAGCTDGDGNGNGTTESDTDTETETDTETATDTPTPEPEQARLRVAHMSPDAPNVDVYVDGSAVLEGVAFGAVSGYLSVSAGDHDVEITPAGTPDTAVFSGTVTLDPDTDYTVAAIGEIGDDADQPFEPLVLADDNSELDEETARLQAVHTSPDAPAVDITANGGAVTLFDGVAYGQSGTVEVDAGTYTVEIRGDTEDNDGDIVASYELTLEGGTTYSAFAAGYLTPDDEPANTPFDLLVATADGRGPAPEPEPEGRLRVAHMSPNAPNVDVYVDGNAVLEDVAFGAVSGYLSVPAGDHDVTITAAGDPDTEVFTGTVSVEGDTDYTISASGELGDDGDRPFQPLVFDDDNSELDDETARLKVIHASPDAPAVDITANGGAVTLFDGVGYGQSGTVDIEAGTYTVEIRGDTEDNDGDIVASYELTLESGTVYTAFAAGYLTPDDEPANTPFDLLVATVDGRGPAPEPEGRLRVAHMSPNAPNVDVYVNGDAVLEDVAFGAVSSYLTVPAAEHEIEITAAGDPDTSVFSGPVTVAPDTDYTVAATGELGDDADQPFEPLVLEDDNSEVGSDQSRLRVVHVSPDAPAVDVTAAGGDVVLFDGVPYGGSGYVEVAANDYTVEIRGDTDTNDGEVVADFDVSLGGGTVYTAFAAGYLTPDDEPADEAFDLLVAQDSTQ
ncbi:DUF4397 domain-containing protein [Halapricum desulfuricans]|nr:DUF4397 domain-containing protein [Halapricum desulfuricans]